MAEEPDGILTLTSWSNGYHFCFVIGRSGVQSSVWRPDITTDISRGFYQSLQTNPAILYLRVGHDHLLPLAFQLITLCRRIILSFWRREHGLKLSDMQMWCHASTLNHLQDCITSAAARVNLCYISNKTCKHATLEDQRTFRPLGVITSSFSYSTAHTVWALRCFASQIVRTGGETLGRGIGPPKGKQNTVLVCTRETEIARNVGAVVTYWRH